jgi:branched-chain amino acid transport system substrate-binding protein
MFPRLGIILVLLLCAVLLGCEKRTEHKLGAILPLSGAGSAYGEDIKRGMDLELEAINAAGGVAGLPLQIQYEDSGSDPTRGEAAARTLVEAKVSAIIGGAISPVTLAAAPVAEENEVVLLSPASSSPQISSAGDYIFRIYPSDVVEGNMMAEFALNVAQLKRIMVVSLNNEYGQGLKTVFIKRYRATPNREILEVINFEQGQTTWEAEVAKIRDKGPDGIYLVGYPEEMLSFLKAFREANIMTPVLASRSFNDQILLDPASEGVIFPRDPFEPERTARARKFNESYQTKFGAEPNIWAANGADAVALLAEAIEQVGPNSDDIRTWLSQMPDWEGASGILKFDSHGDVEKLPIISIYHDGQFMGYNDYKELTGS